MLPKWDDLEDSVAKKKRIPPKEVFPWPQDAEAGWTRENPRDISTKWLATRYNDGNGSRAMNIQNYHWKVKNAYDLEAMKEFQGHVGRLDQGDWNLLAIFRAPEGMDFCPGADLKKMYKRDLEYNREFFKVAYETTYMTATMQKAAFFCMQGLTMGIGAGFTSHSLFRIATETASWAMPNTLYGSFPDCGMTYVLPRLDGEIGMYLALTGKRVETTDIKRIGLATHFITTENISAFEQESGNVHTNNMHDFFTWLNPFIQEDYPDHAPWISFIPIIDEIFSLGTLPEIFEALEAHESVWCRTILNRLKECSPIMLHVTFRLQRIGRYLNSLEDALELEFRVAQNMIENSPDFYEGIRARVMQPGSVPNWQHKSIFDVTNEEIARYFDPCDQKLALRPTKPSKRPEKDPYAIYIPEVESHLNHEYSTHLLDRQLNRLLPPKTRTSDDFKALYSEMFKREGLDEIAAEYYHTLDKYDEVMLEEIDRDYLLTDERDVNELDKLDEFYAANKERHDGKLPGIPELSYPEHGKQKE